jgi:hypothetical protein
METVDANKINIFVPVDYRAPAEWVLKWIFTEILHLEVICLAHAGDRIEIRFQGKVLSIACDFFRLNKPFWLQPGSLVIEPREDWMDVDRTLAADLTARSIPVLWGHQGFLHTAQGNGQLHLDVIGSIFFMLSRYEELVKASRDQNDRFPAAASLAVERGFLYRPIVDEYIEILWSAMLKVWPQLTRPLTAGAMVVTCDVDEPYERWISSPWLLAQGLAGALLRRRSVGCASRRLKNAWCSRRGRFQFDPNWNFAWYMSTLESHGHRGIFYFIPTSGTTQFDCTYSLTERRMQELLKSLSDRGHQIGMHGSYTTYRNAALMKRERMSLIDACRSAGAAAAVRGNRQHYLRWDAGQTADHLEHAGFTYDSSGGYADNPGFRYGTTRTFPMWSWIRQAPLKLRQHPLILMEGSVISYLKLGYSAEAFDLMRRLKKAALKYGDFTMLWHNSSLSTTEDVGLFSQILAA